MVLCTDSWTMVMGVRLSVFSFPYILYEGRPDSSYLILKANHEIRNNTFYLSNPAGSS